MDNREVVAITGSSGFLAQHLIAYLHNNAADIVKEIRCIDRKPFRKFLDYKQTITTRYYQLDLCNETELEHALSSCTTVFHCAAKSYEFLLSEQNVDDQYWHDNINATESLLDVMKMKHVQRLIFVGDAYSFLQPCDNYGLSEYMLQSFPARFMLGRYGESKARAEMAARKMAEKGIINALFLRPTFIYGEGETNLVQMAQKVCRKHGGIPVIEGDNRGNHQFIYAGNMAAIMERSMRCLIENPTKYNGEVVICVDKTICQTFAKFIEPYMELHSFRKCNTTSYLSSFLSAAYHSLMAEVGSKNFYGYLTMNAHRFLNGWTVGFCNRKLRLLLDFVPPYEQNEAMKKAVEWCERNEVERRKQPNGNAIGRSRAG